MKAQFSERVNFQQSCGNPSPGNFAIQTEAPKELRWDHCREQFAPKFTPQMDWFYFCHYANKGDEVAEFIFKFEDILSINFKEPIPHTTFSKTDREDILIVKPSDFWKNCQMKRSLFSLILRCGMNYIPENDNFDEALFDDKFSHNIYVRDTKKAIIRFMFGFTRFMGKETCPTTYSTVLRHGWREEFAGLDDVTVRARLSMPEGEMRHPSVVGLESLWT